MAYIDRITHMNLVTVITNPRSGYSGNVLYEGAWIEGMFLLKKVTTLTTEILTIDDNKMADWLEDYATAHDTDVVLVTLGGGEFEPRARYLENPAQLELWGKNYDRTRTTRTRCLQL